MLGLIALLIFFMFRNGKKRQKAMQELQAGLVPGAEVLIQPGIFAVVEDIDEDEPRVTVRSGTSTFVVHRNAVAQIIAPVESEDSDETEMLAPDDDPAFGEQFPSIEAEESAQVDDLLGAEADVADTTSEETEQTSSKFEDEAERFNSNDSSPDNRQA